MDRLPLPRSPGDRRARADDARRRRLRRHVEPDDLPEGDVRGHAVRRAAARALLGGPRAARGVLRARRAGRRQGVRPHANGVGRRPGPTRVRLDRGRPDAGLRHGRVVRAGEGAPRGHRAAEPLREDPRDGGGPAGDRGHDRRRALDQRHAHLLPRAAPPGDGRVHPRHRAARRGRGRSRRPSAPSRATSSRASTPRPTSGSTRSAARS